MADGVHALEQRPLDVELFDDRFDDPVGAGDLLKVGVETTEADEAGRLPREKRVRLERLRAFEAIASGVLCQIEQQDRHAGVGQMRGNLRAHRARAQNGG